MFELINIKGNTYYFNGPVKIGLIKLNDNEVVLIDSGNDRDAGKRIKKILDENNWKLRAIYNTHSHADHIGGNRYLQNQTNCNIYAPVKESYFANNPIMEPISLYGGNPFKDLKHKFLLAKESDVKPLTQEVLPEGFEIIDLPGHSIEMVGYRTPDNVVFIADSISSKETIDKYKINFTYDIESFLKSLDTVNKIKADIYIPSHVSPLESIEELVEYNRDKTYEIANEIVNICEEPKTQEDILKILFDQFNLKINHEQYVLLGATIRSYLSWLKDQKRLNTFFKDNKLYWVFSE